MWKNKHVIVALLVAPALALVAYFGVDAMVSEKPDVAQPGQAYPLRVMSNCRYASGACELRNGDVRIKIRLLDGAIWEIDSQVTMQGALLSRSDDDSPLRFDSIDGDLQRWRAPATQRVLDAGDALRLVIAVDDSQYYAELPVAFVTASP